MSAVGIAEMRHTVRRQACVGWRYKSIATYQIKSFEALTELSPGHRWHSLQSSRYMYALETSTHQTL